MDTYKGHNTKVETRKCTRFQRMKDFSSELLEKRNVGLALDPK